MKGLILIALIAYLLPGDVGAVASCIKCQYKDPKCGDPYFIGTFPPIKCTDADNDFCLTVEKGTCSLETVGINTGISKVICCKKVNFNAGMETSFSVVLIMTSLFMAYFGKGRI